MPQASKNLVWKWNTVVLPLPNFEMFVYHSTSLSEHSDKADKEQLSVKELISAWLQTPLSGQDMGSEQICRVS